MTTVSNPTILITGASRGLGLALATALAKKGWHLIINGRTKSTLQAAHNQLSELTQVTAVPGDISDKAHRQALAVAAQAAGGLDAIINNASILGPSPQPSLLKYPLDVLETVYRVNVIAQLGILQALAPQLKAGVKIINVTSDAAVEAYPGWGGYGSSKTAFEQLTAVFAEENPHYHVYWVDPGDMNTQMHQEAFPGEDISDRPDPEVSVPAFITLLEGEWSNGRYQASELLTELV